MSQYKRIFMIGHPGAGKAVVATVLAKKLGWQFIDADLGLEADMGRTMKEIVGPQGEEAFHHCLSEILTGHLSKENIVVATDASIVLSEKNRQLLSSEMVVYLKVTTPVQLERMAHNPPPLLANVDRQAFLNKLHQERDPIYEQAARLSLNTDDNALDDHVLRIIKALGE
jgi:shikimate kinase